MNLGACLLAGLALACVASGADAVSMDDLREAFANPPREFRALPMDFDHSKPVECAKSLVAGGWGGTVMSYPGGHAYLQDPKGWEAFAASVRACRENGLSVWIYDEAGYPSGRAGGLTLAGHPEFEPQGLFYDSLDVHAESPKEVVWKLPDGTPFYVALCPVGWQGVIDPHKAVDVTDKVNDGTLRVEAPAGSWRVVAFVANRLYSGTHAVLTGGAPYINVMDPAAVNRYLEVTYDAYYNHCCEDFGSTIVASFNDEASLMGGFLTQDPQPHPVVSWYGGIPERFKAEHGYDIRLALPALFNDAGDSTAPMRCDFYSTTSRQIADSYFGQIAEWCRAHRIAFSSHLLWEESLIFHASFYGSVFPSLARIDWPGIDLLGCNYGCTSGSTAEGGPVTPKLISSVAHLYGKKRTMTESFCFVTGKTPVDDLLAQVAWQWVLGMNSLVTLSISGQYPDESFRRLNEFTGRLGYALTQGRFTADVAVLYPIASVWADFVPTRRHVGSFADNPAARQVDDAWREVSKELLACRRDFDYVDEDALGRATVSRGRIEIGGNSYSILVLPHVTTLRLATLKILDRFVRAGGTVVSYQTVPTRSADGGPIEEFGELVDGMWYPARKLSGKVLHAETMRGFEQALAECGRPDVGITPATREVYCQHRVLPKGDIYFLVNNSTDPVSGRFEFPVTGEAEVWDPRDGSIKTAKATKSAGKSVLDLTLPKRCGLLVVFER